MNVRRETERGVAESDMGWSDGAINWSSGKIAKTGVWVMRVIDSRWSLRRTEG
jgi:hypothetical protein